MADIEGEVPAGDPFPGDPEPGFADHGLAPVPAEFLGFAEFLEAETLLRINSLLAGGVADTTDKLIAVETGFIGAGRACPDIYFPYIYSALADSLVGLASPRVGAKGCAGSLAETGLGIPLAAVLFGVPEQPAAVFFSTEAPPREDVGPPAVFCGYVGFGIGPPGGLGRLRALLQTCNRFVPGFLAGSRSDEGVGGKMWACDGTAGVFCEIAVVLLLAVGHSAGTGGVGLISFCVCAPRVSGAATALRVAEFAVPAVHLSARTGGVGLFSFDVCAPRHGGTPAGLRVAESPVPTLHPSAGTGGVFLRGVLVRAGGKYTAALVAVLRSYAFFGAAGAGFVVQDHPAPHTLFKAGAPITVAIGVGTSAGCVPADAHVDIRGGAIGKGTLGCFYLADAGMSITLGAGGA